MSITVTLSTGTAPFVVAAGTDYRVDNGDLFIIDGEGNNIAAFAPGVWQSAEVTA